jgi:DNA-binding transcriptional regulator LsrR (DeoR family)
MQLNEQDRLALTVAYLTSQGKKQSVIGKELDISQPQVSRHLRHAEDNGWLTYVCTVNFPNGLSEDEKEAIRCRGVPDRDELKSRLAQIAASRSGVPLRSLDIVPLDQKSAKLHAEFGRLAAPRLSNLMMQSEVCAVAWGHTVLGVIEGIDDAPSISHLNFVPAAGEPLNYSDDSSSCTFAAQRLANKFRSNSSPLSLRGVPARVPKSLAAQAQVLREYCDKSDAYRAIFGEDSDALMNRVDTVVTGVGTVTHFHGDWFREIRCMEGENVRAILEKRSAGNIGGIWLTKRLKSDLQIEGINSRWLGMNEEHLRRCSAKAAEQNSRSPGVVVVAIESSKAAIIARTIGLVNHLIITDALARALVSLLGIQKGSDGR